MSTESRNDNVWSGTFQFYGIGRNKASFTAEIRNENDLWGAVKPHLMSNDISWMYDNEENEGTIFVGVFRGVGTFRKLRPEGTQDK